MEKHRAATEAASASAKAALEDAAKKAQSDSDALNALKATDLERIELITSLEQQKVSLEGEKNALSVELEVTNAELTNFLKLRKREDTVVEEINSLKEAYASAVRIQQSGLDPKDEKQREQLEKVGEDVAAAQKASIPTWAYYAVGVATALLPRLFGGAL